MTEMPHSQPLTPVTRIHEEAEFHPEVLTPQQQEIARSAFQRFLDPLEDRLLAYFGLPVEAWFADSRQGTFAELSTAGVGTCTVMLEMKPVPGSACLILSRELASTVLELLLGVPPNFTDEARESLTELDRRVLQNLIEVIAVELREVWLPLCGASFRTIPPDRFTAPGRDELNLQSAIELRGEITLRGQACSLRLIVPSLLVRLAEEQAAKQAAPPQTPPRNPMADALQSASFRVDAVLRGDDIRIRDLLRLKPGAVLQLPRRAGTPLECEVNGMVKMSGGLVAGANSVSFQIRELHGGDEPGSSSPGGIKPLSASAD